MRNSTKGIAAEIAKGAFRPHTALTNMALSYFQNPGNYFAKSIFPICPVDLSSDNYYVFDKGRENLSMERQIRRLILNTLKHITAKFIR